MDNQSEIFNSYVIKSILANNEFAITKVDELQNIKSLVFDFTEYPKAEELRKNGNFELVHGSADKINFREYLEIMEFADQNKNHYLVTVYDSDELWQDPQVINIFYYPPVISS